MYYALTLYVTRTPIAIRRIATLIPRYLVPLCVGILLFITFDFRSYRAAIKTVLKNMTNANRSKGLRITIIKSAITGG